MQDGGSGRLDERPMSLPAATLWTIAVTFLFIWLLGVFITIRPAAQSDFTTTFGCQAAAYLLGLFGILRLHGPQASIRDFLGVRRTHAAFYPLAVLLGLSLEAPIGLLYDVIARRWPSAGEEELHLLRDLAGGGLGGQVLLGAVLVVLGPALEEVLFRGAMTRPLRRSHDALVVIAATAALFAMAHLQPQKFPPIALFGLALGVLRHASGSLLPSIVLHATYNAVPFVALLVAPEDTAALPPPTSLKERLVHLLAGPSPLPTAVIVGSAALAVVLLALIVTLGRRSQVAVHAREKDRA
ncbi:CPBP family intramembrane glutamic endopeptidase [Chondromyces apiculatus]|nr:CPBP family intramembrane glutamic endopeptidase [Chondromyces apiculatus]